MTKKPRKRQMTKTEREFAARQKRLQEIDDAHQKIYWDALHEYDRTHRPNPAMDPDLYN